MTEISSDVIRGYNDTIILFLLRDKPSYGYEISKMIKELSGEKYIIKETTLYSAFSRLEENGYVESYSQTADNGKKELITVLQWKAVRTTKKSAKNGL